MPHEEETRIAKSSAECDRTACAPWCKAKHAADHCTNCDCLECSLCKPPAPPALPPIRVYVPGQSSTLVAQLSNQPSLPPKQCPTDSKKMTGCSKWCSAKHTNQHCPSCDCQACAFCNPGGGDGAMAVGARMCLEMHAPPPPSPPSAHNLSTAVVAVKKNGTKIGAVVEPPVPTRRLVEAAPGLMDCKPWCKEKHRDDHCRRCDCQQCAMCPTSTHFMHPRPPPPRPIPIYVKSPPPLPKMSPPPPPLSVLSPPPMPKKAPPPPKPKRAPPPPPIDERNSVATRTAGSSRSTPLPDIDYRAALSPPPPGSSAKRHHARADSLSLVTLFDAPGSAAAAVASLVLLCCCLFSIVATRCASGRDTGADRPRRTGGRRARTANYDAAADEDPDEDYDDAGGYDDDRGGAPAVRIVRCSKSHPPSRMGRR